MAIDIKISDHVYQHLAPQIDAMYEESLQQILYHQMDIPCSHIWNLIAEKQPKRLRLFNKNNPTFEEFLAKEEADAVVRSSDLDPVLSNRLTEFFKACSETLEGRYENDGHKVWAGNSHSTALKKQLMKEFRKGLLPPIVPVLMNTAQNIAMSNTEKSWQQIAEKEIANSKSHNPQPGA